MAFLSLDAKIHFGEAEWSPQCHPVPSTAHLLLWEAGPLQAQRAAVAAFTRRFLMHVALERGEKEEERKRKEKGKRKAVPGWYFL